MAERRNRKPGPEPEVPAAAVPALSFEQAVGRLEEVVRELETGDLSLEIALTLFQEGVTLARECSVRLDEAEARIEKLLDRGGHPETVPLDPSF